MTPSEVFAWTAFLSTIAVRWIADYAHQRLYVQKIHIHHFLFGFALTPVTFLLLYWDFTLIAMFTGGLVIALVLSEIKELITQDWKP